MIAEHLRNERKSLKKNQEQNESKVIVIEEVKIDSKVSSKKTIKSPQNKPQEKFVNKLPDEVIKQIKAKRHEERLALAKERREARLEEQQKEAELDKILIQSSKELEEQKKASSANGYQKKKSAKQAALFLRIKRKQNKIKTQESRSEEDADQELIDLGADQCCEIASDTEEEKSERSSEGSPSPASDMLERDINDSDDGQNLPELVFAEEPGVVGKGAESTRLVTVAGNLAEFEKRIMVDICEEEEKLNHKIPVICLRGGRVRNYLANQQYLKTDLDYVTDASVQAIKNVLTRRFDKKFQVFEKHFGELFVVRASGIPKMDIVRSKAMVETCGSEEDKIIASALTSEVYANAPHMTRNNQVLMLPETFDDIRCKRFRTIGHYGPVFTNDPLRMLRIIYASTNLCWSIPRSMAVAMYHNAKLLNRVHDVRQICVELTKLLTHQRALENLSVLYQTGIFNTLFPEIPFEYNFSWITEERSRASIDLIDFVRLLIIDLAMSRAYGCKELAMGEVDLIVENNRIFKHVISNFKLRYTEADYKSLIKSTLNDWINYESHKPFVNSLEYLKEINLMYIAAQIKEATCFEKARIEFNQLLQDNPLVNKIIAVYCQYNTVVDHMNRCDQLVKQQVVSNLRRISKSAVAATQIGFMGSRSVHVNLNNNANDNNQINNLPSFERRV